MHFFAVCFALPGPIRGRIARVAHSLTHNGGRLLHPGAARQLGQLRLQRAVGRLQRLHALAVRRVQLLQRFDALLVRLAVCLVAVALGHQNFDLALELVHVLLLLAATLLRGDLVGQMDAYRLANDLTVLWNFKRACRRITDRHLI